MSRKKEREYALKGVFQLDFHPEPGDFTESIAYFLEYEYRVDFLFPSDIIFPSANNFIKARLTVD